MDCYTKPDLNSIALITIDTQCDTLDGQPLEIPGTSAILPRMKQVLDSFRRSDLPIVHIVRIYQRDGSNADLCRRAAVESGRPMLLQDSDGCQITSNILPDSEIALDSKLLLSGGIQRLSPHEVIIYKPRWGAFYNTPLDSHLRGLGISTLAFTGCNFPNCPRTSIYEASERDYRLILVTDAVSGLYDQGISEMKNIGVELLRTDAFLSRLSSVISQTQVGEAPIIRKDVADTAATGMVENQTAAKTGGKIAKRARLELEAKTGKKVVTGENYLPTGRVKRIQGGSRE